MKAIVLAAGYATRLYPLTRERAKPLLEVGGTPLLSQIVEKIQALPGMEDLIVVCNAKFADQFEEWRTDLEEPERVRILNDGSTDEHNRRGATGDLAFALRECPLDGDGVLVAAGDALIAFELETAQALFRERRNPTLIVRQVTSASGPSRYNEVELAPDGRITAFREKPRARRSPLAAVALYFYPPEVADWVETYLSAGGDRDAPGHFVAWLVARTSVVATPLVGSWFDIGDAEALAEARAWAER